MRMRKYGLLFGLAALFVAGTAAHADHATAASGVRSETKTIVHNGKTFHLNLVAVDLKDPTLEIVPTIAQGGIGHDEPFSAMIERENAMAAINGTFFNAYEKNEYIRYPNGTLYEAGRLLHSGDHPTLIVTGDKAAEFRRIATGVSVTVGQGGGRYTFRPWGVNKYYGPDNPDQVVWYTPEFGGWIGFPGTKAVVRDGRIERMTEDAVEVPADGHVAFIGHSDNNRTNLLPHLHAGDEVEWAWVAEGADGTSAPIDQWLAAVGAGPKLVTNGAVDVDPVRDGFDDPKITQYASARSFAAVDGADRLVLGTVNRATIAELAQLLAGLGMKEAMNLDGGASSGLYANGAMLTVPGRELGNALVVRKLDKPKVQLVIDGRYVPNFHGFVEQDTTMVPVRSFIEALQAEFRWEAETLTAVIRHNGVELKLPAGSASAYVNGKSVPLDRPLSIVGDRMYTPLRFVVEKLNGTVEWNAELYRVSVDLP